MRGRTLAREPSAPRLSPSRTRQPAFPQRALAEIAAFVRSNADFIFSRSGAGAPRRAFIHSTPPLSPITSNLTPCGRQTPAVVMVLVARRI